MAANPSKLKRIREIGRSDILFSLALGQEGRAFLGSSDFSVYQADLTQDKPEFQVLGQHESYVTSVTLAGDAVVSGGYDGRLIWWSIADNSQVRSVDAHQKTVRMVVASPDRKLIASVADDMVCRLWDAQSGVQIRELRGHEEKTPHHFVSMLYACAFSPDGKHLATGDKVGHIVIWDMASGEPVTTLETPTMYTWDPRQRIHSIGGIRSLAFSADGKLLAVGGIGQIGNIDHLGAKSRIEVFEWQKGERTLEMEHDKLNGLVERLVFDPQGEWLFAAGGDHNGFLYFVDLKSGKEFQQEKPGPHVHDVAFSDDFETLYTAGHGKVFVYEMKE